MDYECILNYHEICHGLGFQIKYLKLLRALPENSLFTLHQKNALSAISKTSKAHAFKMKFVPMNRE